MVTGLARSALGPTGRFRYPSPFLSAGQITLATAREQALQFAKYVTNNQVLRGMVESQRGRWIDPHLLVLCPETYFLHPQLLPFSVDSVAPDAGTQMRRTFGPQWIVPLCNAKAVPELTVQVAVDDNAVRFRNNAPEARDDYLLWAFAPQGLPDWWPEALPVSAERAVRFVFDQLGVRVADVPQLFARGRVAVEGGEYTLASRFGAARSCNRWRIVLERDVALEGVTSKVLTNGREVWVSNWDCSDQHVVPVLQMPLPVQPAPSYIQAGGLDGQHRVPIAFSVPIYTEQARLATIP